MKRRPLSEGVQLACLDTVNRALRRSALPGLPASALLAVILGSSVPMVHRGLFVAFVWVADIATFLSAGAYLSRRARGEVLTHYWLSAFSVALIGAAWGSAAVIALPSARHMELRTIYMLFVCGVSATYVVGAAARRSYYYATQLPMMLLAGGVFLLSADRVTRLLGLAVPIFFFVMTTLHHEVHAVVVHELELQERNDDANEQLREVNEQLTRQALHDTLTGLANRAAFVESLERAVAFARRDGSTIGVLYFDIDRFKVVNDSLGHSAGDELLVKIAERVRSIMRVQDLLARLGGDEFTILLDRLHDHNEAVVIAERVLESFAAPFEVVGRQLNVSASIGIATNVNRADGADALLLQADAAQYRAKEGGRNRIEVFDGALREAMQRRLDDEQELREAIANGEITAYFQPEVDLHTGRILGAEALARWVHPTRGVLDAGAFVPLAEEAGLVFAIDDRVITAAAEARVALALAGVDPAFRIWCNVSAHQLTRAHPTDRLSTVLERVGCDPHGIGIEITETAILADMQIAAAEIAAARMTGIKVALDDFGTGYSSMTLLRSLPIDKVKIDRSFVRDLADDRRDAAIVRSIVTLGADFGLEVVAEGVETDDQRRLLETLGCDAGQGFLWSPAISFPDLAAGLCDHHAAHALPASASRH